MAKCYWCGATNEKSADCCCVCRRKIEWSNVLKALLRPSVGCLLGDESCESPRELAAAGTSQPAR